MGENMRIPVEDLSNKSNEWISTRTGKDAIKIIHKKMQKQKVKRFSSKIVKKQKDTKNLSEIHKVFQKVM